MTLKEFIKHLKEPDGDGDRDLLHERCMNMPVVFHCGTPDNVYTTKTLLSVYVAQGMVHVDIGED